MSEVALIVIRQELGLDLDIDNHDVDDLVGRRNCLVWYYRVRRWLPTTRPYGSGD